MSEISSIDKTEFADNYVFVREDAQQEEAAPAEERQQLAPGESEKILKAQEDLHKVLSPNLRNLESEQEEVSHTLEKQKEISSKAIFTNLNNADRATEIELQLKVAETPKTKFSLLAELFKIKVQAYKKEGLSIEALSHELISMLKKEENSFITAGKLQDEILKIYTQMLSVAEIMGKIATRFPYQGFFLQLFEIEKETGFIVLGTDLLAKECMASIEVLQNLSKGIILGVDLYGAKKFYWNTAFSNFQKVLQFLEGNKESEALAKALEATISLYLNPSIYTAWPMEDLSKDPLVCFFPYVVKYASLENIEGYFNERFKNLSSWDKAYKWIDLCCQAGELLASIDPKRSSEYFVKAENTKKQALWAFPFSPNRTAIETKEAEATARIAEARAKIAV